MVVFLEFVAVLARPYHYGIKSVISCLKEHIRELFNTLRGAADEKAFVSIVLILVAYLYKVVID